MILNIHDIIETAKEASKKADCSRKSVGAVVYFKDSYAVLATGCNHAATPGTCIEQGHLLMDGHCIRTFHAEMRAITNLLKDYAILDWTNIGLHVTCTPCINCIKLAMACNINTITWSEDYYLNEATIKFLEQTNLIWGKIGNDK